MSDGASDEVPRFPKPLQTGVAIFKELKFDVLLCGVNAAGLSAFNPVERRMAPLSHDLAGIHYSMTAMATISMKVVKQ